MTIETKFDLGDPAWLIDNNHAVSGRVISIRFSRQLMESDIETVTIILDDQRQSTLRADQLFKTKEELIQSL